MHAATTRYTAQYEDLAKRGPSDVDLPAVVPPLDTLRGMHGGYGERDQSTPVTLTFGLYQGAKLGIAATDAYVNALNRLLLPRLLSRIETRIQSSMNNPDFLYQTLKVYLILGRQGPLDKDLVMQWLNLDLLASYPTEEQAPLRNSVLQHADAMLDQPLQPIPLNDPLIAQARSVLTREPLAAYSYNRLLRSKSVQSIPVWSVAENGGPGAARVFQYPLGQAARCRRAGHLYMDRLPQRVPAAARAGDPGPRRGQLGARPREARRHRDAAGHDEAPPRRVRPVSR